MWGDDWAEYAVTFGRRRAEFKFQGLLTADRMSSTEHLTNNDQGGMADPCLKFARNAGNARRKGDKCK